MKETYLKVVCRDFVVGGGEDVGSQVFGKELLFTFLARVLRGYLGAVG